MINEEEMKRGVRSLKTGQEFLEKTKYAYLEKTDQSSGVAEPPLELGYDANASIIDLPLPQDIELYTSDLTTAIQHRKSIRKYSTLPLSLAELSHLLWCTQGVKEVQSNKTIRTVPSAGSRHPLETWLVINNVSNIQPGLYRFLALRHQLALTAHSIDGDIMAEAVKCCRDQNFINQAAALFIWAAVPYRTTWRYGERGYRYLFLDAGHVCQNLYLAAESIDAGVCAINAYDDDRMNALIGLDGVNAFSLYMATVGKK